MVGKKFEQNGMINGTKELAMELEDKGYDWIKNEI